MFSICQALKHLSTRVLSFLSIISGLAYLDTKLDLRHDLSIILGAISAQRLTKRMEKRDQSNFWYIFEQSANKTPNAVFLVYQDQQLTYHEFRLQAHQFGNYLIKLGIKPKDVVAVDCTNKPNFLLLWLGLLSIGAVPAFINFNLSGTPLMNCVSVSDSKLFIFDSEVAEKVESIKEQLVAANIRLICVMDPDDERTFDWAETVTKQDIAKQENTRPSDSLRSGSKLTEMEMLLYTSGTTGLPKAAVISFMKLAGGPVIFKSWLGLKPSDRLYTCMPLYHGTALILGAGLVIVSRASLVLGHKFSRTSTWNEIRQSQATCFQYVGEMCRYLLSAPVSPDDKNHNLRLAFGNGLRPDVWNKFRDRFGVGAIAEFYGATEGNGGVMNYNTGELGAGCVGRMGLLLAFATRKDFIVVKFDPIMQTVERGPGKLCMICDEGEKGEFVTAVNKSRVYDGYYRNPVATEKKVVFGVLQIGDLYFRTGDIVTVKRNGFCKFITFEDRIGDTFRWKGENVSTLEVETAMNKFSGIVDASVYGVALPNHDGRAGCAAIALTSSSTDYAALAEHLNQSLPSFAVPLFLRITEDLRLTGNMKHRKYEFREEGVDPSKVREDKILWLRHGTYIEFAQEDWEGISTSL